jgi:hypothetical protein
MIPESDSKSAVQDVTDTTPDLLSTSEHFSGLCYEEQTRKTSLECINPGKTLTVREALFLRESVLLSIGFKNK